MARPLKAEHERRAARFNLRFTAAELAHVQTQALAAGIEPTEYLRRRALGFQVAAAPHRVEAALISELNSIGNNLNQIARGINSERRIRIDTDLVIAELRGALEKVVLAYGS